MRFVLDAHCHTVASGHAYSTVSEYVAEAKKKNLELIAITDHAPKMPGSCGEFYFGNFKCMPSKFGDLEVLYGSELNIIDYDGNVDLPQDKLSKLDVVIASLHPPCLEPLEDNTDLIMKVMDNPYVNIFGHLGDPRFLFDIKKVVKHAKKTGTIIEINNASLNPDSTRFGGKEIIQRIIDECVSIDFPVLLSSDAHFHMGLANFDYLEDLVKNLSDDMILNTSVDLFKKYLFVKSVGKSV